MKPAVATANLPAEEFPEFQADVVGYRTFASQIVQLLPQPVFSARIDGRVDFVSRSWQELTGGHVEAPSIDRLATAIPEQRRREFLDAWRAGIERGERFKIEALVQTSNGPRWQLFEAVPVKNHRGALRKWLGTISDVDEARRASASIEESESRLRFLEDAGRAVSESLEIESITQVACRELMGPFCDGVAIECSDLFGKNLVVGEGRKPWDLVTLRKRLFGPSQASLQYASLRDEPNARGTLVALPILSAQRFIGTLTLVGEQSRAPWGSDDLAVLSIFARRIGTALENARLYARERRVAQTLQGALLPQKLPLLAGIQFDSVYLPNTDEANVGGDWYDAFELGDGRSAVSIGDVTGHGLLAATVMGSVRTAIRVAALNGGDASDVLMRANRLLYSESRTMVTALFGIIDAAEATFRYAVAGHPPPLILAPDGSLRGLALGGPPLGIMRELELDMHSEPLGVDETLLLYTDGVVEIGRNAVAGEQRLRECASQWIRDSRPGGVAALARNVLGGRAPGDDIALLAATVLPSNVMDVTLTAEPRHSAVLRDTVREFAEGCNLAKSRLDDFVLGVGEAVNNAIVHAYGEEGGTVRVRASRERSRLTVEVTDNGRWRPRTSEGDSNPDRVLPENGRGLVLMRHLADEVEVDAGERGTRVTLIVK